MRSAFFGGVIVGCLFALGSPHALAANAPSDARALATASGRPGGLCLLIGTKDLSLAKEFAALGYYVQVLQPDRKLAAAWGLEIAQSDWREKAGVRCADFDPEHYGSDLFNVIVIDEGGGVGKATRGDLVRILVPNGVAATRSADVTAGGKDIKASPVPVSGFKLAFKKAVVPAEWMPCDSVKWRAGPRAQHCLSFHDVVVKDGTLTYLERMEVDGDISASVTQKVVRDAYNGRVLETEALSKPWPGGNPNTLNEKPGVSEDFDKTKFGNSCFPPIKLGKYILFHHNIWINPATKEKVFPFLAHPACFIGHVPVNGFVYNFPSRKGGCLEGITAIGAADVPFDHEPGGKVMVPLGAPAGGSPTRPDDWPMFRANSMRGNSAPASVGPTLKKAWEAKLGLGGKSFGVMCGQRTGLTQPVSAYGLVIVSDIDAQRIVALDAASGATKWIFPVGSRVDFSPTLYNGLCLFAAKDGWIYALNAANGAPVWKLLVPSRERIIGGQEKLESLWPTAADVMVVNGVGYASAGLGFSVLGGARAVAFKPETGEVIWRTCYNAELTKSERQSTAGIFVADAKGTVATSGYSVDPKTGALGREFRSPGILSTFDMDDYLAYGNSISRTNEDRAAEVLKDGRTGGRSLAFDAGLSVSYALTWGAAGWEGKSNKGEPTKLTISAVTGAGKEKKDVWSIQGIEMITDDLVLTQKYVFAVGHYQRVKKNPELWVLNREDGKVLTTLAVEGLPAFNGMSAAGNRLFVATREGTLICYESK